MNSAPNREKVLKGYDDDSYIHRIREGQRSGPMVKRQDEVRAHYRPARTPKPKGQHAYRRGNVKLKTNA